MAERRTKLLVIEDDESALRQLRWTFDEYEVLTACDRASALEQLRAERVPVVLLDLGLPPDAGGASEGLAALAEIRELAPETRVVVVTGREEREHALAAIDLGAHDFYQKPVDAQEIRLIVARAVHLHGLQEESSSRWSASDEEPLPGIIGTSEALKRICRTIERAARSDISVLLVGESGTGKEVLVRALHALSARAAAPLVAISCVAIPATLLESELFGHERGAFTGALRRRSGRIESAQGGTFFLDEIGDMPVELQAKLLRFLQERTIQRLGGGKEIPVDVRIACAANRDLRAMVAEGDFREDLYYRLSELSVEVPPLRERSNDCALLARHFFERFRKQARRPLRGLTQGALEAVSRHPWPGNVRELENRVKRGVLMAEGTEVTAADLELGGEGDAQPETDLKCRLHATERDALLAAWSEAGGNVSQVSRILGVSRPTVYRMLREHGLKA
jgi:two-component system NtrC family response regulator